jgi:outer membrane lipoprotein-sorting protein
MSEYIYQVVVDDETYWIYDPETIRDSFGTVQEVTRFRLVDPLDVTDSINGNYFINE